MERMRKSNWNLKSANTWRWQGSGEKERERDREREREIEREREREREKERDESLIQLGKNDSDSNHAIFIQTLTTRKQIIKLFENVKRFVALCF